MFFFLVPENVREAIRRRQAVDPRPVAALVAVAVARTAVLRTVPARPARQILVARVPEAGA